MGGSLRYDRRYSCPRHPEGTAVEDAGAVMEMGGPPPPGRSALPQPRGGLLVSDDAAVVQEERQPLVLELAEPVTDALDLLAEQVDGPGSGVSDPVAGGGCEHIGL